MARLATLRSLNRIRILQKCILKNFPKLKFQFFDILRIFLNIQMYRSVKRRKVIGGSKKEEEEEEGNWRNLDLKVFEVGIVLFFFKIRYCWNKFDVSRYRRQSVQLVWESKAILFLRVQFIERINSLFPSGTTSGNISICAN